MEECALIQVLFEGRKGQYIYQWDFLIITDDVRIYYNLYDRELSGFEFYAVNKTMFEVNEITNKNEWDENFCFVECIFYGVSYFDGVRHLFYGDKQTDNEGYHYYPNLEAIISAMQKLKELEEKYCRER